MIFLKASTVFNFITFIIANKGVFSFIAYRHEFQIKTKRGIIYQLKADSEEDKLHWIEKIQ